ncbi:uncharacterized protein LOC6560706 isoform X1 [Drosophila grimshawi]|uniref:GH12597 n=1 Tax=Drosophila grimshawi TaxID=7222 RepID=B4J451_DROGR|nr:uncharacterized protein LOC6560706 isoform X1 [Drosophila grimshawi]EDV90345.1 GH12597 [Drosophila grimshawi]EDW02657.1 GH22106 [Drosophila grimshawi]
MTNVEPQVISISISSSKPKVGYLKTESTRVNCPACEHFEMSIVEHEVVTSLQWLLSLTKLFKKWSGRVDINHYCAHCGCYIGRYVPIGCYERCISNSARKQAVVDEMRLKTKPKDCAVRAQKSRENILAKRAEKRAQKQTQLQTQTQ